MSEELISVIIPTYNREKLLRRAIQSVQGQSYENWEIIVVDNNSVDGSIDLINQKFNDVVLISNKENTGFSVANNQGIKLAKGENILLLNPDTVVQEDTFIKCLEFLDNHKDAGALGVKMYDGNGRFLPESKRGLPTPSVAFYKIFGLSAIFPQSRIFGRYHLGYLSMNENHKVDVLSGAFMLIRNKVLDEIGLLDETFFMYGEDIDLSYRIKKAGYENYYFSKTKIIHYKGESTKKSSINYVFVFYKAMIIFAEKHFSKRNFQTFSKLINIAIYLRASIAVIQSPPIKYLNLIKGNFIGLIIILSFYALLPKSIQFSRAIILGASLICFLSSLFTRSTFKFLKIGLFSNYVEDNKNVALVGSIQEIIRTEQLMLISNRKIKKIFRISPFKAIERENYHLFYGRSKF